VAFNSFAKYAPEPNPETKKGVVCFALNDARPVCAFAGIWTEFTGDRGTRSKPISGPHLVYGFLTTRRMRWQSRNTHVARGVMQAGSLPSTLDGTINASHGCQ
jgi:hypothetical protein